MWGKQTHISGDQLNTISISWAFTYPTIFLRVENSMEMTWPDHNTFSLTSHIHNHIDHKSKKLTFCMLEQSIIVNYDWNIIHHKYDYDNQLMNDDQYEYEYVNEWNEKY